MIVWPHQLGPLFEQLPTLQQSLCSMSHMRARSQPSHQLLQPQNTPRLSKTSSFPSRIGEKAPASIMSQSYTASHMGVCDCTSQGTEKQEMASAPSQDLGGHNQLLRCHSIPMHMKKPFPMQVGSRRRPLCHTSKMPHDLHGWAQKEEDVHMENLEGGSASWLLQEKHHQVC
ncbi:uncharacterized protein PRD47_015316 isoform 1-T1 [Ara ararauna]